MSILQKSHLKFAQTPVKVFFTHNTIPIYYYTFLWLICKEKIVKSINLLFGAGTQKRLPLKATAAFANLYLSSAAAAVKQLLYQTSGVYWPSLIAATSASLLGSPLASNVMLPVTPSTVICVIAAISASFEVSPFVCSSTFAIAYTPS